MRAGIFGLPLAAAVIGCSPAAKLSNDDLRCYAAASAGHAAGRSSSDVAVLQAYYLGRLEAADPTGGWADAALATMDDLKADPSQFSELSQSCVERLRASLQKQRAATRNR